MEKNKFKTAGLVILDAAIIDINYLLALLLRFEFDPSGDRFAAYLGVVVENILMISLLKIGTLALGGLYKVKWKTALPVDFKRAAAAALTANVIAFIYLHAARGYLPKSVSFMAATLDILFICLARLFLFTKKGPGKKILKSYGFPMKKAKEAHEAFEESIEELSERKPINLDIKSISDSIEGRIVLVTGAGGEVASELSFEIAKFSPRRVVLFDISEEKLDILLKKLRAHFSGTDFAAEVGSTADISAAESLFERYKPHVIFHAATRKNIRLMESRPAEAVKTNVIGTKNMLDMAICHKASRFILISNKGAENPSNATGASMKTAEEILKIYAKKTKGTVFTAIRLGETFGGGQEISLLKEGLYSEGKVKLSGEKVFLTVNEAAKLILTEISEEESGKVSNITEREPIDKKTFAENFIRLRGLRPYKDIDIKIEDFKESETDKDDAPIKGAGKKLSEKGDTLSLILKSPGGAEAWAESLEKTDAESARQSLFQTAKSFTECLNENER